MKNDTENARKNLNKIQIKYIYICIFTSIKYAKTK